MVEEGGGGGREGQCSLVSLDSESSVEFSSSFIYVIERVWSRDVVITSTSFSSSFVISPDSTRFDNSSKRFICSGLKCSRLRGREKRGRGEIEMYNE